MATKIYVSGGSINIEGVFTDVMSINPTAFDWSKQGSNFTVRDKIENQSYKLGVLADIQNKNGLVFATEALLINYLNELMFPLANNFELAVAMGLVDNVTPVNKFGSAPSGVQTTATDIWDRADATPTQQIWVAPTEARKHILVSTDADDSCGSGTLTLTGQPLDTETVTIGTKVYTFQDILTDVDGNVLIGASASESLDNLIAAINLAAGSGTIYAASTTAGSNVIAEAGAGDTMILWDQDSLSLATTVTLSSGSWGAATITPGTGARKIRIYGLKTWDTNESNEDIVSHGTSQVVSVESYVIIHRMKVLTAGTGAPNEGTISATSQTDASVTAVILPDNGQTEMAIYGIPSTKDFYLTSWRCNIDKAAVTDVTCDFQLKANESPQINPKLFLRKYDISVQSTGANMFESNFKLPIKFTGPCIIKVQGIGSAADIDAESSFDGYLVNK